MCSNLARGFCHIQLEYYESEQKHLLSYHDLNAIDNELLEDYSGLCK